MGQVKVRQQASAKGAVRQAGRASAPTVAASRQEACRYIETMAAEMAELAYSNNLDAVAVACDVVREIAAGNVRSKARWPEGKGNGKFAGANGTPIR